ncbi:MAG: TldD/PmbA family protein [Candidatus Thorarchaeota archaeon]
MTSLTSDIVFEKFEEQVNNYKRRNQYFDLLYDSMTSLQIKKTRSAEDISYQNNKCGFVARTFLGYWKEYASNNISDLKLIKKEIPNANNKGELITEFEGWKLDKEIRTKIDLSNISIDEKLQEVREIYDFIQNYDNKIVNSSILYKEFLTTRIFVNNEGCRLSQIIPRVRLFIKPISKEGSKREYDYYSIGGEIGFEIFDEINTTILEQVAKNSLDMLESKSPPSGKYPLILDPDMTGIVAHESFGHGLEADQIIRDRSYLKDKKSKKVASEICVICDNPSIENELGSYFFDDEGIKAGKNILVENGILKNFIYDRRTASELNAIPKGNGRRETFAHPINVRMSNTYIEPGDYELEEMIAEIDYGVMLIRGEFGMEDPIGGGMQCTSTKGYLIENGEKTQLLSGITLSGSVLDFLKNIDAISNNKLQFHGGTCGKGNEDLVPVTSGGSYIRVKEGLISPG